MGHSYARFCGIVFNAQVNIVQGGDIANRNFLLQYSGLEVGEDLVFVRLIADDSKIFSNFYDIDNVNDFCIGCRKNRSAGCFDFVCG